MRGDVKKTAAISAAAAFVVSGAIFFTVGWFSKPDDGGDGSGGGGITVEQQASLDLLARLTEDRWALYDIREDLGLADTAIMEEHLAVFAEVPHLAGQDRDEVDLVNYIKEKWEEYGLDDVAINTYEVLLSYPDPDNPNFITIVDSDSELKFNSSVRETVYPPDDLQADNFVDGFLAWTPKGEVPGNIAYINYGRQEDYDWLLQEKGDDFLEGMICMARYGQIFRGNKVSNAAAAGCTAAIIFSDPEDVAPEGTDEAHVYPNDLYLPGDGIQRGSAMIDNGDPETPVWPSIPHVYRSPPATLHERLPPIPAQPIGYDDAKKILEMLDGDEAPEEWWGGIDVTYKIGGSFDQSSCSGCVATVSVNNFLRRTNVSNVVGSITGDAEPDRFVLVGNHRDAWGFGAIDPNSGTTQMMETARVLAAKANSGSWRPRRTIVFHSWAAEEYGLVGSKEFTEDFAHKLKDRAVVYINLDNCASGTILEAAGSPTVAYRAIDAAKVVPAPFDASDPRSYFDYLVDYYSSDPDAEQSEPSWGVVGSGSDHSNFIFILGVPVVDLGFGIDAMQYPGLRGKTYPAYHTGIETFSLVDGFHDPGFLFQKTCADLNIYLTRDFADRVLLDYRPIEYANVMNASVAAFELDGALQLLEDAGIETQYWIEQIGSFATAAMNWQERYDSLYDEAMENPLLARSLNDQMMMLDRTFLLAKGLPGRPEYQHVIISPSQFDSYGDSVFPGVTDLLEGLEELMEEGGEALDERKEELEVHLSDLMIIIKAAAEFLDETWKIV